jgi:hypothetical protein
MLWSFAHSVKVDREDNIWVADKGPDMVIKFNPEGRVLMVFGRKQEASDEGAQPLRHPKPPLPPVDGMFRQVTDMAWDAAGNTYILCVFRVWAARRISSCRRAPRPFHALILWALVL